MVDDMVSSEKLSLVFNLLILFSSLSLFFWVVVVWGVWDYSVITAFLSSFIFSFACFHSLKLALLKNMPKTEVAEESSEKHARKSALLLFVVILLIVLVPIIILFLIPQLGLPAIDGVAGGAAISNLILYIKMEKKAF
jgi:hypothetical protein